MTIGFSWLGALFLVLLLPGVAVLGVGHIGVHLGHRREGR